MRLGKTYRLRIATAAWGCDLDAETRRRGARRGEHRRASQNLRARRQRRKTCRRGAVTREGRFWLPLKKPLRFAPKATVLRSLRARSGFYFLSCFLRVLLRASAPPRQIHFLGSPHAPGRLIQMRR